MHRHGIDVRNSHGLIFRGCDIRKCEGLGAAYLELVLTEVRKRADQRTNKLYRQRASGQSHVATFTETIETTPQQGK